MTSKDILDNLEGIDPEFVAEAAPCERKANKIWGRWVAAAACLALAAGFALPHFWKPAGNVIGNGELWLPVAVDDIIWGTPDSNNSSVEVPDDSVVAPDDVVDRLIWGGFPVSVRLYEALEQNTDPKKVFAICITRIGQAGLYEFQYQGVTLGEINDLMDSKKETMQKLRALQKEGLWLRFGEVLYTTGIPKDVPVVGGDKWSEKLYRDTVADYGEDFLAKYIVDGELLSDKITADLEQATKVFDDLYEKHQQIRAEFGRQGTAAAEEMLKKQGLCTWNTGGKLYWFATEEELENAKLAKLQYYLSLGSRAVFDGEPAEGPHDMNEPLPEVKISDALL